MALAAAFLTFFLCIAPASGEDVPAAAQPSVTLVAVGDIRLDGPVGRYAKRHGNDAPVRAVSDALSGDILFGNLECSLTSRGKARDKTFTFRAPPESTAILKAAGFDIVSLANNHVMDFGEQGLQDTKKALDDAGILHVGAGDNAAAAARPVFIEKNGLKIGFLGITSTIPRENWAGKSTPGVAYSDVRTIPNLVKNTKKLCDILVVSYHGGTQLMNTPNPVQKEIISLVLGAGADVVLGHHPHVLQPITRKGTQIAFYSLGNFLFVSPTPGTQWTAIARLRLSRSRITAEMVPIEIGPGVLKPAGPKGREVIRQALDGEGELSRRPESVKLR